MNSELPVSNSYAAEITNTEWLMVVFITDQSMKTESFVNERKFLLLPECSADVSPIGGSRPVLSRRAVCVVFCEDGHTALVTNESRPGNKRYTHKQVE